MIDWWSFNVPVNTIKVMSRRCLWIFWTGIQLETQSCSEILASSRRTGARRGCTTITILLIMQTPLLERSFSSVMNIFWLPMD